MYLVLTCESHTIGGWALLISDSNCKSDVCIITWKSDTINFVLAIKRVYETFTYPDVAGITLDVILIPLIIYVIARTCTQWHMVRWQKKFVNGNDPEKLSKMQKTNPKNCKWDQEGRAEIYADITIYATDPARLVSKICHHKLHTTIATSLTLSNIILSSVAKMHAACLRSPHNVLDT